MKLLSQLIPIIHIVIKISPYHQGRITSPFDTGSQLIRHSGNQISPPSAIYKTNCIASLPWPYPGGIKFLHQPVDKYRVNAATLNPFVKTHDLRTASHEPIPLRLLRQR